MRLVIVTGMSGAGKSSALKMLEDAGYFCVDNLPIPLIPKFADLAMQSGGEYDHMRFFIWMRLTKFWSSVLRKQGGAIRFPLQDVWKMGLKRSGRELHF